MSQQALGIRDKIVLGGDVGVVDPLAKRLIRLSALAPSGRGWPLWAAACSAPPRFYLSLSRFTFYGMLCLHGKEAPRMVSVRFIDVRARPTEFLDFTSLTLDEFQLLVPPF